MSNRVVGIAMVALTLLAILPVEANAQRGARIRASARVSRSVVPETQLATKTQLAGLTQTGNMGATRRSQSISTAQGIAHLYTERLAPELSLSSSEPAAAQQIVGQANHDHVRLTVAYTAN